MAIGSQIWSVEQAFQDQVLNYTMTSASATSNPTLYYRHDWNHRLTPLEWMEQELYRVVKKAWL